LQRIYFTATLKLVLLGTGTSQGVPVIGCECAVCTSDDPRDRRLRSSALLLDGDTQLVIDAGPDFRQQMLRARVRRLDGILLTHEHNDHVIGIDDVRPFNFSTGYPMCVYALPRVAEQVKKRFEYIFGEPIPGAPRIDLIHIGAALFRINGIGVQPIEVMHGRLPILGFRFGDLTYLTDVKTVAPEETEKIKGTKYLITSALHHKGHPVHMNLPEALEFIATVAPEKAWLTHISHQMGLAAEVEPQLPPGVSLAYDGLEIEF
jgi:phosphoribosyl 1,2-cyclic phosphate phosphodiesterase